MCRMTSAFSPRSRDAVPISSVDSAGDSAVVSDMANTADAAVLQPAGALSDERIDELLKEAETRLRAKAGLAPLSDETLTSKSQIPPSTNRVHLPRLEHNLQQSSYLKNQNGVTRTNPNLMVPEVQRKMAEGLRTISTNTIIGKKVVCPWLLFPFLSHEEIKSQSILDAHQHLILRLPYFSESIHLYS